VHSYHWQLRRFLQHHLPNDRIDNRSRTSLAKLHWGNLFMNRFHTRSGSFPHQKCGLPVIQHSLNLQLRRFLQELNDCIGIHS
jgi:hypothetical protein